jgi:hypothetical protein
MAAARIKQVRLRNFKSFGAEEQTVDLHPLTALIGRNNSGKSTVIQSLLLLKQTLEDPRPEVELSLQGQYLRAASLRELTHGWPEGESWSGPEITLRWEFTPTEKTFQRFVAAEPWFKGTPVEWLLKSDTLEHLERRTPFDVEMALRFTERESVVLADRISLNCTLPGPEDQCRMDVSRDVRQKPLLSWRGRVGSLSVTLEHFIPHPISTDPEDLNGRSLHVAFGVLYAEPLRALKQNLSAISYIGANREEAPPYYAKPTSLPTRNILPTGGNTPELLYARQADRTHLAHLPALEQDQPFELIERVAARPLKEVTNEILRYLGIHTSISFQDVQQLGLFRLLFGRASINHVGRGIGHVLPVLVAGLLADPLLGDRDTDAEMPLADYLDRCAFAPCLALEEIESHLHPKAQTRLAHVMLALALSGRQLIVETHSDHLIRRLRGLVARSAPDSETERWLLENVGIVEVEQTEAGVAVLRQEKLTREGSIDRWRADFMDEATDRAGCAAGDRQELSLGRLPGGHLC